MPRIRLHKLAALVVLGASAAWVATGEFSSVGSASSESDAPAAPSVPAAAPDTGTGERFVRTVGVVVPPRIEHARAIRVSGTTEANRRATLAARTGGVIEDLPVDQGDLVETGDLILRLEGEGNRAAVDMAQAMLSQRQAELEAAERLASTGNVAKLQLDSARTALATAQAQLEASQAELNRFEIVAPFGGLVDRVMVEQGSSILQGAQIATLIDLDPILAVGEVSEHDLDHLKIGEPADVKLVSGRTASGTLRYVSRDASTSTRTFRVEVAIDNPERAIPAGMTAEITLRSDPVDAVFLPRSVVTLSKNGDIGVRVVGADGVVSFVPIDLIDDTPRGLVLGGVPKDARIIVAGQDLVSEGDTVNPVEADAETVRRLIGEAGGAVN